VSLLRDRLLRRPSLIWPAVAWSMVLAAVPCVGEAAPFPPGRAAGPAGEPEVARTLLDRPLVRAQLASLGVSEADAAELWARLTPAERLELAARADELRTGGNPAAAAVAIAIVVAMVVILALELIGRRVISRP
jgi:hypothetical protein